MLKKMGKGAPQVTQGGSKRTRPCKRPGLDVQWAVEESNLQPWD